MRILIGCPVYKREFILPLWLKAIEDQDIPLSNLGFIFELGPDDEDTHNILFEWHANHPEVWHFDGSIRLDQNHSTHPEGKRSWNRTKYYRMVEFRNSLLDQVNVLEPDFYFSLDSDILLTDTNTISHLVELAEDRAVSPLSYMTPKGTDFPSVMSWLGNPGGRAKRFCNQYPLGTLFQADIIMAAKMMPKEIYRRTRYRFHPQGEDLGWCTSLAERGFKAYCASYLYGAHIMNKEMLTNYIKDGDSRKITINSLAITIANEAS